MEAIAKERLLHVFIVLNPMAGKSTAADVRAALGRHFSAETWTQEVYETIGGEQVAAIVRAALARGCDLVVAAGGDGTVSEVAEALVHTGIPLGIVPVGTANVLARELGLPLDLDGACVLLASEHATNSIDAMQVGDKAFFLQIGVGIDSLMIRDTDRAAKRRFGRAAYLWNAIKWLIGYQPRRFTIVVDGRRLRPRAAQVLVANGGVLGMPPFSWGPHIRPDDGRIDVCVLSARALSDYLRVGWQVLIGHRRRGQHIRYYSAERSVVIDADRPLPVQADGEILGETPVQVRVVPDAVAVVVPQPSAPQERRSIASALVNV